MKYEFTNEFLEWARAHFDPIDESHARIAQLTAERAEWRQDAERLAKAFYWDELGCVCIHCGEYAELNGKYIPHKVDCPITLHRELVKKYEVTK